MKIKLGNFIHNLNNDLIINRQLTSRRTKNNLVISQNPIIVNKMKKNNSINFKKKKSKSKNIFQSFNEDENYSKINAKKYNKSEIKKLLDTNDYTTLKKNQEMIKFELNKLNKKIKDNKNSLDKLIKNLSELNEAESEQKKLMKNYINKKENLEKMSKTLIFNLKNKNNVLDNEKDYKVNISLEELYTNNKESFINQVFQVYNEINNNENKKYYNFIKSTIDEAYQNLFSKININSTNDKEKLVNNFFKTISKKISKSDSSEKILKLLLTILMKKDIIKEKIDKILNYNEHQIKINEFSQKIDELKNKLISFQFAKNELTELKNKIIERIEFYSDKQTPFFERTIYQKSFQKKNLILNCVSSSFNFQKQFINKLNMNTINKSLTRNNFGESKNKTEREYNKKNEGNVFKRINLKNKGAKYHSNKISFNKINLNEIYKNFPNKKEKNNEKFNKTERGQYESPMQNGLNKDSQKYKIKKLIRDDKTKNNIANSYNNLNSLKLKHFGMKGIFNDFNNGKTYNLNDKKYNNLKILKVNKELLTKAQKKIDNGNKKRNAINVNLRENKRKNDDINPVYKKKNNNLTNILSIHPSFFYTKKINNNIKNWTRKYTHNISLDKRRKINQKNKLIYKTINDSLILKKREDSYKSYQISKDINLINTKTDNAMKSFCYYKYLDTDSTTFNPLNNNFNLKNSEYNEGLISIDISTNSIRIGQIHSSQNDSIYSSNSQNELNFSNGGLDIINIELKNITNVYIDKLMENILKIHSIFLKYNSDKENEKTNKKMPLNINKLLNMREIMNIKDLTQGEKIKASLCNFFSLILEYNNSHKIELILINFNQFNIWFNYLKDILCNNIKSKNSMVNGCSIDENKLSKFRYNNHRKINCRQNILKRTITEI